MPFFIAARCRRRSNVLLYALAVHPPHRVPAALNGFGLWNVLVLVLMLLAYGYPIAQFVIEPSPGAIVHRVH